MLTAPQIVTIIEASLAEREKGTSRGTRVALEHAAAKIADILEEDNKLAISAAVLENEVTSTLMDMLAATILATLIDQEGGGRTNISFSPHSMKEKMAAWSYAVETDGMIRTVRISPVNADEFEPGDGAAIQKGMILKGLGPVVDSGTARPQAEPKEYKRPIWVIRYADKEANPHLAVMHDRADAARHVGDYKTSGQPWPEVQNRWCLHPECPTTGCLYDDERKDSSTEVASEG